MPKSVCNRTQAKQIHIYDYILEEIGRQDKIGFKIYVEACSDDEETCYENFK